MAQDASIPNNVEFSQGWAAIVCCPLREARVLGAVCVGGVFPSSTAIVFDKSRRWGVRGWAGCRLFDVLVYDLAAGKLSEDVG
jgi:hypothetical protein